MEELRKCVPEKSVSVEISVNYSIGACKLLRAKQLMGAWLVKFQREAKTLLGLSYEESVMSSQLELKNRL